MITQDYSKVITNDTGDISLCFQKQVLKCKHVYNKASIISKQL